MSHFGTSGPNEVIKTMTNTNASASGGGGSVPTTAGRTNYGKWEKLASDLVADHEREEEAEAAAAAAELGHDKYARSQGEVEERMKAAKVEKTKQMLDAYKKREEGIVQTLDRMLGEGSTAKTTTFVTRDMMGAGKRVATLADTTGPGKIILTEDLSNLESAMPTNSLAKPKRYDGDAENDVVEEEQKEQDGGQEQTRRIYGLIKLHLHNLRDCTVIIRCKIITSTVEISNCHNVTVKVESSATVATVQADLCEGLDVQFWDAPSNQNTSLHGMLPPSLAGQAAANMKTTVFWGEDKNDRVLHAGVTNLRVSTYRDGYQDLATTADYKEMGAKAVGNATPEEMQFVTSVVGGKLVTEKVARNGSGSAHGGSSRVMTEREVEEERKRKENAPCPENMIRFIDVNKDKGKDASADDNTKKGENATKPSPTSDASKKDEDIVEEVYCSVDVDAVVRDCEAQKVKANESFSAGEYAQAVLLYTLVMDRCAELPDSDDAAGIMSKALTEKVSPSKSATSPMKQLFPRHIILSNRSASFLKLGEHEKALKDAEQAVALDPTYVKAVFRMGLALHAMGRYQDAVPALGAAHTIEPKNKQIKQALQFAEVRLQQEMRKRMEG
jgi:hypothetical protein